MQLAVRIVGLAAKVTLGLVLGIVGLFVGMVAIVIAVAIAGAALLVPLLPVALAVGAVWLLLRRRPSLPARSS